MAHNKKHKKTFAPSGPSVRSRVEKALAEQRTQQALDLARTLYRQEATPDHRELFKKASLARARDLIAQSHFRDAAVILANTAGLDTTPAFLAEVAQEVAACGDLTKALELRGRLAEPALQAKVLAHIADEVLRQGDGAKQHLPADFHGQLDLIRQAFAHAEKGEDDAAREKLQGVGLQSPFLEWKLFLRGLLAYYTRDDARASENWQRLDPKRWPFRLAAPLRFAIDPDFARSQPPDAQNVLQQQNHRQQGLPVVAFLRTLQQSIIHERQLPQALRTADQAVPLLKTDAPQLVPRLAACFYWAIIHHGMPEDMQRYRRTFGAPADDPEMARLEALALEARGDFQMAHKHWQRFEKSVVPSKAWPPEQKDRVRSLVWARMGRNADNMPDFAEDALHDIFGGRPARPQPLKPGAAECFEQALKLAPDQQESYQALITHHLKQDAAAKAEAAARRLLEHFPNDVLTLELMGDLLMRSEKHAEALDYYKRALQINPLEQRTRHKLANAHSYYARSLAEQGQFDAARTSYQAALALDDRREKYPILCKWAACEFKAGQAEKAEELLQKAYAEKDSRLAVVFSMLIETIRFKLTKLKAQFNKDFNALLAETPSGAAAAALAETSAQHRRAGVKYHGQQTHEKKVRAYLENALTAQFTEDQLRKICAAVEALQIRRLHHDYIKLGQTQYPSDPYFYLAEAKYGLETKSFYGFGAFRAGEVLKKARDLTQALPRGDRQDELTRQIQECEQRLLELNPFGGAFQNLFGGMPLDPFGTLGDDEELDEDGFF